MDHVKIEYNDFLALKEKLKHGETLTITIGSNSMLPLLKQNDQISVAKFGPEHLKRFTIVAYFINGILRCHYIHHFSFHEFDRQISVLCKGTQNAWVDRPIMTKAILGVVSSHQFSFFTKLKLLLTDRVRMALYEKQH